MQGRVGRIERQSPLNPPSLDLRADTRNRTHFAPTGPDLARLRGPDLALPPALACWEMR